jgi:hypothetical protein
MDKNHALRQPRWRREWVILGRVHLDYLDRVALDLGVTPSAVVRKLVEEAMLADRQGDAPKEPGAC